MFQLAITEYILMLNSLQ